MEWKSDGKCLNRFKTFTVQRSNHILYSEERESYCRPLHLIPCPLPCRSGCRRYFLWCLSEHKPLDVNENQIWPLATLYILITLEKCMISWLIPSVSVHSQSLLRWVLKQKELDGDRTNWARIALTLQIVPLSTGTPKAKHAWIQWI